MNSLTACLLCGRVLAAAVLLGSVLRAQELQWEKGGDFHLEQFGYSVAVVRDLDGDLVRDVLVGAPDAVFGRTAGSVFVLSGANGSLLSQIHGPSPGDCFGVAVEEVGDVDGDGVADFALGAHQRAAALPAAGPGFVTVVSGADGSLLHSFRGSALGDRFGTAIAGADLDGDGFGDVVVGAPGDFTLPGFATAFSGATGFPLHTWSGDRSDDRFGVSLTVLEDVDLDGRPDVAIGAPQSSFTGPGYVRVFSGATSTVVFTSFGDAVGDEFGRSVDGGPDVDGDGLSDLAVGAVQFVDLCSPPGYARVLSGNDGSTLRTFAGTATSDFFGFSVCLGDDASGDGLADLLVGAPQPFTDCAGGPGYARLFSIRTDNELYSFIGETALDLQTFLSGNFGLAVELVPDLDGDGIGEILAGGPVEEVAGSNVGQVRLYRGNDLYAQARPRSVSPGAVVKLTTAEGSPGNLTLVALTSVDGTPTFVIVFGIARFADDERRVLSCNSPPALSGSTLGFKAFALDDAGRLIDSADELIAFL